jgi:hypothetical protein
MKKVLLPLIAASTCLISQHAAAIPIRATFSGTVAGSLAFDNVLNDFPVGTAASFDVTFDDSGLTGFAPATDLDLAPVSGWLRLGSLEWMLNGGRIASYSYLLAPDFPVTSYGLQLTGLGPLIAGNASLFGLFLQVTPDAAPDAAGIPRVGFRYPVPSGEIYSYADLAGNFMTSGQVRAVPEPGTALLMCCALALLAYVRPSRRVKQSP